MFNAVVETRDVHIIIQVINPLLHLQIDEAAVGEEVWAAVEAEISGKNFIPLS